MNSRTDPFNRITSAAEWLAALPLHQRPKPIFPQLRKRFDLSTAEACEAIRQANTLRHARAT